MAAQSLKLKAWNHDREALESAKKRLEEAPGDLFDFNHHALWVLELIFLSIFMPFNGFSPKKAR